MKIFILFAVALAVGSCSNNNSESQTASGNVMIDLQYDTLCFQKVSGNLNQDTATIQLLLQGESVKGRFSNVPFEKDARIGTLSGTKKNSLISCVWAYSQEGMVDSLLVEFKLSENTLLQKDFKIDSKTGREILTDSSSFSIVFNKIKCSN